MSLRSRLAILFGVVGLLASVFVGTLAYRSTTVGLRDSTDDFLRDRASETAEVLNGLVDDTVTRGSRGERTPPGRFVDGRLRADDDSIIQVSGPRTGSLSSGATLPSTAGSERVRESSAGRDGRRADVAFDDITIGGESYRMISRGTSSGGLIQVARSTTEDDRLASSLLARFVLIAALVAASAAGVGWLIASRATAPLRRLANAATDVATTRDLTTDVGEADRSDEIGTLARSLRTMLDALEASRLQQHRLIHDAGHELRTPLTSLRANVALLERATELPDDDRREVLGAIRSELVELGDLFDEMIDLATDQRDVVPTMHAIDLDDVVRDVARRWERRSDRPISVTSSSSVVLGDTAMLERAVNNLVSNADKFGPAGTEIEIRAAGGSVSVRDSGPGIPVEDRSRVFDRFFRSETTRSMPGSGLGLSIVAQVVDVHDGETWVSDAPSGGADVGFRIPLFDGSVEPVGASPTG